MAGKARKGQYGFVSTSKVIAEFVDEIPARDPNANWNGKKHIDWAPQAGTREALQRAFQSPGRAMLLLEYTEGAPSRKRNMADLRVAALKRQGYVENAGWIVKSVENKVYVLYTGASLYD